MDETQEFFHWIDSLIERARGLGDEREVRELISFKAESVERARRAAQPPEHVALSSALAALDVMFFRKAAS